MEILYTNCAGLDGHKKTVKVCVLTQASNGQLQKEFRTYFTTTEEVLKLSDWLKEQGCTHVAEDRHGGVLETGVSPEGSATLKCSSSMRSLSKPSLGERRMSKTRSGLPTSCSMVCSKRVLSLLARNASCGT